MTGKKKRDDIKSKLTWNNKKQELVERYARLFYEGTWHIKEDIKIIMKKKILNNNSKW